MICWLQRKHLEQMRRSFFCAHGKEIERKILIKPRSDDADDFYCKYFIGSGPLTSNSAVHVTADNHYQAKVMARMFARHPDLEFGGAFHTHPSGLAVPSETDRQLALDILLERRGWKGWDLEQFLVLIGTQLNHEFTIRAYVIGRAHQEFVEIPVVITGSEERTLGHASDAR